MTTNKKDRIPNAPDKGLVPKLRFPEFKGEWKLCKIQEYGNVITGNTPPTKDIENYEGGTFLWASPSDLGQTKYIEDTITKLSKKGFGKARILPKDSILVTCIGSTIGKMGMATKEMSSNQQINSIVVDSNFDKDFVYYAIMSRFPKYLSSIAVQAVPILSKSSFEKLDNCYTSYKEQCKIGKFLNLLDIRIATQSRAIEKYESLINGLQESILWKDYKRVSFSEIFIERNERTTISNQFEILSSTIKGIYRQSDYFDKEIASINNVGYKVLYKGDVVLSPQNLWLGNINYNDSFETGMVSPSYKVFYINDKYNPFYISCFLKTHKALYEYACASEQGASIVRRNLDFDAFMAISIPIPSIEVQNRIAKVFSLLYQKHKTEIQILEKLNKQKEFLLSQMFI